MEDESRIIRTEEGRKGDALLPPDKEEKKWTRRIGKGWDERGTHRAARQSGKRKSEARMRRTLKWIPPSHSASAAIVRGSE